MPPNQEPQTVRQSEAHDWQKKETYFANKRRNTNSSVSVSAANIQPSSRPRERLVFKRGQLPHSYYLRPHPLRVSALCHQSLSPLHCCTFLRDLCFCAGERKRETGELGGEVWKKERDSVEGRKNINLKLILQIFVLKSDISLKTVK